MSKRSVRRKQRAVTPIKENSVLLDRRVVGFVRMRSISGIDQVPKLCAVEPGKRKSVKTLNHALPLAFPSFFAQSNCRHIRQFLAVMKCTHECATHSCGVGVVNESDLNTLRDI